MLSYAGEHDTGKEVVHPTAVENSYPKPWPSNSTSHVSRSDTSQDKIVYVPEQNVQQPRKILGLRKRWFFLIIAATLIIIVAAATGGGIAASRKASEPDSENGVQSQTSSGSSINSPTQTSSRFDSPSSSSSTDIEPTTTSSATAAADNSITTSTEAPTSLSMTTSTPPPQSPPSTSTINLSSSIFAALPPNSFATTAPDGSILGVNPCPDANNSKYTPQKSRAFTELCDADWILNTDTAPGSQTSKVVNLDVVIVGSFHGCIDRCALWNEEKSDTQYSCQAVSYRWNITDSVTRLDRPGNCILKTARGKGLPSMEGQVHVAVMDPA